jgi:hypothetical protein
MKRKYIKIISILFVLVSFVGFMVKLPKVFEHYDKALHFLFYFYASFIGCYFYANNKINFIVVLSCLIFFGFFIEYLQGYSNRFFKKSIHGNFDIQDIKYNILGISLYSSIWIFNYFFQKAKLLK